MSSERKTVALWWSVGAGFPILGVGLSLALQAAWWNDVPARMPKHWNGSGVADAIGTPWSTTISTFIVGLAVPALMIAITAPSFTRGARGWVYRFLAAMSAAMSALGAVLAAGIFWLHRFVPEGGPWPRTSSATLAAFASALVVGVLAYFVQPKQESTSPAAVPMRSIALRPGESAIWINQTRIPRKFLMLLIGVGIVVAGMCIFFFASGQTTAGLIYVGIVALLALIIPATSVFTVRVDATGFTVVSALGWPRVFVPYGNIADARAVMVDGLTEFGGYGVRAAPGAFGVVLRNGEAIEVTRVKGRRIVVTVDDAATGAALVNELKSRA